MDVSSFSFPSLQEVFPSSCSPVARVSAASSMGVKPAGNLAVVAPVERPVSLGLPDFSMVHSMADKIVSNELFELLDEMTKTRFSHLLISESDDVYVKQIKSLSTEILLLRSQVEDKMVQKSVSSNSGVDPRVSDVGKEPRISASSYSSWKNVVNLVKEVQHLKLKFIPPTMLHYRGFGFSSCYFRGGRCRKMAEVYGGLFFRQEAFI